MPSVRTCAPPVSRRCTIGAHVCSRYYNKHPPCPRWDTDRVPLGHRPCTTGTPTVYHWDTARVPLGHRPCTTGTPTMYHWDTDHVPLGHRPCTTGTPPVYHWATHRVPVGTDRGHHPCPAPVRGTSCAYRRMQSTELDHRINKPEERFLKGVPVPRQLRNCDRRVSG